MDGGQRKFAERFRVSHRRSCARTGDDLRGPDQEQFRELSAQRQVTRVPQPDRRQRMAGTYQGSATAQLLRERSARRDVNRFARALRRLLRNDWRTGLRFRRCGRSLEADCARPSSSAFRRSTNAAMIRVVLPPHLRTLARVDGEVELEVKTPVTQRSVLDALEAQYPMLRGTIRDHVTRLRRPMVRFFACGEDLSHEPPDVPLPDVIAKGSEPFVIIGAIAGG